ncbi:hypothetical protein V1478_005126 [Vespula squamosa]|uniref:Uncharacterized protein n=1 Tax=Vespula squamosa TaxID=30214 RepID=A0ABD2BDZ6_VESSQ
MIKKKVVYLPYKVNPLIKKKYHILENALREEEEKLRPIREAEFAREKAIRDEIELQELEKLFLNSSFVEKDQENLVNEE